MKKITLIISTFLLSVILANAAVTLPMDYTKFFATSAVNTNGTDLETGNAAVVNTWYLAGTANGVSPTINSSLLSYSNYIDNTNGKKIVLSSGISAARTSFFQFTGNATDLPGGRTYYLSFLIKVSSAPSAAYAVLSNFINGTTSGGSRGRIQIKANATSNATGFYLQPVITSAGVATSSISYNYTHLIVLKYDITTASSVTGSTYNTDGAAAVTIFVDPTIGNSEPSSTSTVTQTAVANLECIKSLVFNQQPGLGAEISGIRFGTTWADVCQSSPAVRLTTPTNTAATTAGSTGFTANWNAVSNASSYNLAVYQNGTQVGSTITGISGTNYAVSGLNNFITYTYKVTAVGDGTNYSNSDPSTAQSVTTLDPNAINNVNINFADGSWTALTGTYSDISTNGYDFIKAKLTTSNYYGSKGELHTKYVDIDNKNNFGKMTLPTVNSLAQIEIHAATGTADRTFDLKVYNTTTGAYDLIATYMYNTASKSAGLDSVYIINLSRSMPTKFRIENSGYGSMSVMQVITRTTALTNLSTPTASAPSQVTNTGFTASWTQVANAAGYEIRVFEGSAVRKALTVNDGATLTADVTGLTPNTMYFYRVAAIADGTNYLNSFLSPSGGSFTTANEFSVSGATNISTLAVCPTCDLIVNNGAELIVDESRTYKSLTIAGGGKVTNDNVSATTLTITNNLVLESNATNGTATYVEKQNGTLAVSGTKTVKQYTSSTAKGITGRNWYISSPLSAALSSTITTATGNGLVYYDGTTNWPAAGTTMVVMKGYIAKSPAQNTTIEFTGGDLNTGYKSVTNLPVGFNLVGNPYPSYVDWTSATKTGISTSIWYRSKSTGSYLFQTYNVTGEGVGANGGSEIIPPMQSFWVKTTNATNELGFTNAMRSHQDQSVATNRLKVHKASTQQLLRLQVSNGTINDEAVVYFNENAQNTLDAYDTQKMFVNLPEVVEIYTLLGTDKLVINGMNAMPENVEIPIGITAGSATQFSLKATEVKNFAEGTKIILKDSATGNTLDLSDGSAYDFDISIPVTNRFALIFRAPGVATDVNAIKNDDVWIFSNSNNQIIVNCKEFSNTAKVSVYNAVGQKIVEKQLTENRTIISNQLKSGVYFVTINNGLTNKTQKVILK